MNDVESAMIPSDEHPCIIKWRKDPELRENFYWVHCACHDGNEWYAWKVGDRQIKCKGERE